MSEEREPRGEEPGEAAEHGEHGEQGEQRLGIAERRTRLLNRGPGTDRIAAFSDGVFAFAMTLLVIDVTIPRSAATAIQVLQDDWPAYLSWGLSFVIVGYIWVGHHRRFQVMVRHDTWLIVINLALLFLVTSVPFPTSLLGDFAPERTAVVLYAVIIGVIPLVEMAEWTYAYRAGLLAKSIDRDMFRYIVWDFVPIPVVFGLSIPVSLIWGGEVGMWCWVALVVVGPLQGILSARAIDKRRAA